MLLRFAIVLTIMLTAGSRAALHADDLTIALKALTAKKGASADARFPTPAENAERRAVLPAGVNTAITLQWTVRHAGKGAVVKDALIHCFVVKQEKDNQREVPKLNKNVVVESALTMDFKAQDRAEGEVTFSIAQAGSYLLRVEIKGTAAKTQPFAALDIVVK